MRSKSAELKTKICDTVNDWKRNVGRTPSLKELGDELGVNKSTIYRYLVEMNEDGLLEYDGSSIDTKELNRRTMNTARAAIVGSIPCGEAQSEEEYVEEYVNLPTNLFGKGDFYILRAKGDSMEDAGISEGDLVVILKQPTAEVGDIVVALDDQNQNTLKRFGGFDDNYRVILEYMNEEAVPDMVKSFMDDTPDDETEKEWHELTQFDLTIEDAKAYVYSFSSRRRVHGWQNIKIRLFV